MATTQKHDGWWIDGEHLVEDCGPYTTRAEAESDRRGLERFFRYQDRPGFITSERTKRNDG
jgi:hypothetical protein